ncbi:MAG: hypothetical protein AB8B83_07025 [Bdellovibrionales bacterium]
MYQEAFTKLELEDIVKLLETYNPLFNGSVFDPVETTIMAQDMPFYPGCRYLDISDHSCVPPIKRFVIDGSNQNIVLDWTNIPIYQLNKDIPINLNEETATDYVRFFFNHVRGKNGRFLITETVDDIRWRDDPPPTARKTIGEMLHPLIIADKKPDSGFFIKATVMFKDSLFECDIDIDANGQITLDNEKLLVEDMPVIDDSFGH